MGSPTHRRRTAALVRIESFHEQDYAQVVDLSNAVYPEYVTSEAEIRHRDSSQPAHILFDRFLAIFDDRLVGVAEYWQQEGMYHPRHFSIDVIVHPEMEGRGVGSRLYDHLLRVLAPHRPLELHAMARETSAPALAMAKRHGFVEGMREWESRLDLARWDPRPFGEVVARAAAEGIQVTSYAALADDPERERHFFDLLSTVRLDVPRPVPATDYSEESYRRMFEDPNFLPEGNFIALADGRYVGVSNLWGSSEPGLIYTGLTGVLRDYRRRGVAMAMKVHALNWARAAGYRQTRTWNATTNRGMLRINEQLGFVRQPAWIKLKWRDPAAGADA